MTSSKPTPAPDDLRQWLLSVYAQDSFRINQKLTLNYRVLRWEPTFADPDKYKRGTSFNQAAFLAGQVSTLHPNAPPGLFFPGDPGIPAANWNGRMANFAPRVGLAWNIHGDGRDTLRIGGGVLYDSTETWFNERETTNPPFGNQIDVWIELEPSPKSVGWLQPAAAIRFRTARRYFSSRNSALILTCRSIPGPHLCGAMERHLSAAIREGLGGLGELPGQQDHPSLDRRREEPRGVSGHRSVRDRRCELHHLLHHGQSKSAADFCPWRAPSQVAIMRASIRWMMAGWPATRACC